MKGPEASNTTVDQQMRIDKKEVDKKLANAFARGDIAAVLDAQDNVSRVEERNNQIEDDCREAGVNSGKLKVIRPETNPVKSGLIADGLYNRESEDIAIRIPEASAAPIDKEAESTQRVKTIKHEEDHQKADIAAKKNGQQGQMAEYFGAKTEGQIQEALPEHKGRGTANGDGKRGLEILGQLGPRSQIVQLLEEGEEAKLVELARAKGVKRAA